MEGEAQGIIAFFVMAFFRPPSYTVDEMRTRGAAQMIRELPELNRFETQPWDPEKHEMTWIWNQLMGETAKGDTLEYTVFKRGDEEIFAGVLRGSSGELKGLIPVMYEQFTDGVLLTIDYSGQTRRDDMDTPGSELEVGHVDDDINEIAFRFFRQL